MDDTIYRQAAIDALIEDKIQTKIYITATAERDFEVFNGACDRHAKMLKELPSAQPERKRGKWILKDHRYECDNCGCRIKRFPFKGNIWNYNFCPNCGEAKGGDEE